MKQGWKSKRLGEISFVIAGQSPEGKYYNNTSDGFPFYQGKKEFTKKYIGAPTVWTSKITKQAETGDILMSVRAPVGPINFATQKICIGRGLAAIRSKENIDNEFLFYFLLKHEEEIIGNAGAVFNSINKTQIENILIPIPPLPEQNRIVAILDEAFSAIAKAKENAEKNLRNSKELFESYLQSVFANPGEDWEEKKLGECFKLKSGVGLTSKMMNTEGRYPVFGGNGIAGMHDEYNLSGENIIVGRVGALCGNARYLNDKIWLTDNAFKVIDFRNDFEPKFLNYLLNFKNLRSHARQAAQPVISNSSLGSILLQFPKSVSKQKKLSIKFDEILNESNKLGSIYIQKLNDLEELKKSILQKAFNGELETINAAAE